LLECKTAYVGLRGYGPVPFEVLRHESDKYVIRGPAKVPGEIRQTLRVDPSDVFLNIEYKQGSSSLSWAEEQSSILE
jgi:hypothetical protein